MTTLAGVAFIISSCFYKVQLFLECSFFASRKEKEVMASLNRHEATELPVLGNTTTFHVGCHKKSFLPTDNFPFRSFRLTKRLSFLNPKLAQRRHISKHLLQLLFTKQLKNSKQTSSCLPLTRINDLYLTNKCDKCWFCKFVDIFEFQN